ncbi:MAG: hypothetical protein U0800_20185 [Isosphaeraceae bacterium]
MRFQYVVGRPTVPVTIFSKDRAVNRQATLDTAAALTIFPAEWAGPRFLSIDLTKIRPVAVEAANGTDFEYRPALVTLLLANVGEGVRETFVWRAVVGFSEERSKSGLIGISHGLECFDATFHGSDGEVVLVPGRKFLLCQGKWQFKRIGE